MAAEAPDTGQAQLLAAYQALLERSRDMQRMARAGDWESLVEQESHYLMQVEQIKRLDAEQTLDRTHALRKAALVEEILEQDLETRRHLVARRDELSELIGHSRRQQALNRTYGAQQRGGAGPVGAGHQSGNT